MEVFVGWSGPASRTAALAISELMRHVLQTCRPWMSERSIAGGRPWLAEVKAATRRADYAVLCVTPDAAESRWIHFEAGLLDARGVEVCPWLVGMEARGLKSPLADFQVRSGDREGTWALLQGLRDKGERIGRLMPDEAVLRKAFDDNHAVLAERLGVAATALGSKRAGVTLDDVHGLLQRVLQTVEARASRDQDGRSAFEAPDALVATEE